MKEYDHNKIEKKWQKEWNDSGLYKTLDSKKAKTKNLKPFYVLDMFPYPSGAGLHVGHPRGYIGSDVYARVKRMQGYNVLHPMGYDAFGLPAEQYAIEHKIHPRKAVDINVKTFEKQLSIIGLSYDWSRRVNTTDPEYYRWTQWIFLQLFNSYYDTKKNKAESIDSLIKVFEKSGNGKINAHHTCKIIFSGKEWKNFDVLKKQEILMNYRLAYEAESEVNWCEGLGTVLANDEIVDGKDGGQVSERGGFPVEKMIIKQWSMRITAYADRLLDGLKDLDWAPHIKEIQKNWIGKDGNTYLMRDAIFARQRYWGEPIPLKRDKDGIISTVKKLPLELPKVTSYEPTGKAEGPLAGVKSWVADGYETNTMPGWAGSSWYYLRYMDPKNNKNLAGENEISYWKNVDMYVGGAEHATGHLLYSRFWHKFLKDIGITKTEEPFKKMKNQGMILASDNRKMSKRWGNVINPDEIVKTYGADTLRVYEMFMGPFDQSLPWSTESIIGSRRFIERVWRLSQKVVASQDHQNFSAFTLKGSDADKNFNNPASLEKVLHKTIKKVNEDIENFAFNTAISSMMIFVNEAEKHDTIRVDDFKMFLQILAPFAPHFTDELWHDIGEKKSIHISGWPKYNPKKIIEDTITIAVQVNGKVRAEIRVSPDATEDQVRALALEEKTVLSWVDKSLIKRFIYVKGRLVNIVV